MARSALSQQSPTKGTKQERSSPGNAARRKPAAEWAPGTGIRDRDPSPLAGKKMQTRISRMLGVLEAAASAGDVGAAKYRLDFFRWSEEMKHGRPGSRGNGDQAPPAAVIITNGAAVVGADPALVPLLKSLKAGRPAGALPDHRTTRPADDDDAEP